MEHGSNVIGLLPGELRNDLIPGGSNGSWFVGIVKSDVEKTKLAFS